MRADLDIAYWFYAAREGRRPSMLTAVLLQNLIHFLSLHRSVLALRAPLRSVLPSSRAARARNRVILV